MGWLPTHYRQMNIILKLFIQLESNTCSPLLQSLFKQSTDWSWHCMKLMCKIRVYNNSRNPTSSELHNITHTIAIEDWESQLNKPLDPSS